MATHVKELDKILDDIRDLSVAASEDGLDEQAATLEEVLEQLRGIDFNNGVEENEDEGTITD